MINPNNGLVLRWTAVMIIIYAIVVYLIVDSHRNKKKGADTNVDPKINFTELTDEYETLSDSSEKVDLDVEGTVTKIELSGGFYGVITDAGDKYLPINIQKDLTQGKRTITMSGYHKEDVVSFYMWGTYMYVTEHNFPDSSL